MKPSKREYSRMTDRASPPSKLGKDLLLAYLCGGAICTLGQILLNWYQRYFSQAEARALVSVTLVGLSALFTALHLYQKFATFAGAGSLVPITGFANAMVSPAIEFKTEGWILGLGANLFRIPGPVLTYGTLASVVYGVIYWVTTLF